MCLSSSFFNVHASHPDQIFRQLQFSDGADWLIFPHLRQLNHHHHTHCCPQPHLICTVCTICYSAPQIHKRAWLLRSLSIYHDVKYFINVSHNFSLLLHWSTYCTPSQPSRHGLPAPVVLLLPVTRCHLHNENCWLTSNWSWILQHILQIIRSQRCPNPRFLLFT